MSSLRSELRARATKEICHTESEQEQARR